MKYVVVVVCLAIVLALVFFAWLKTAGGGNLWATNLAFVAAIDLILSGILIITSFSIIKFAEQAYPGKLWHISLSTLFGCLSFVSLLGFIPIHLSPVDPRIDPHIYLLLSYIPLPGLLFSALAIITGIIRTEKEGRMNVRGIVLGVFTVVVLFLVMMTTGGSPYLCFNDNACARGSSCTRSFGGAGTNIFLPGVCIRAFRAIPIP